MASQLPSIQVVLVDEIHDMVSAGAKKAYNMLKNCSVRVGFSGTPFKFGGSDQVHRYLVKGWIGNVIQLTNSVVDDKVLTTKELQERNILSSVDCTFFKVKEPQLQYEIYQDAVTKGIAENNHFHKMVSKLVSRLSGRTLILVERIEHGERLEKEGIRIRYSRSP